ncbi:STAS domain-containing protein [Micromonospora inositola]|uniref:Anti-sigma factor antagonist n=1 Tax=Micromonospora inositola TaxID=47865 RepID=A0A1C5IB65_9ACTN|nr:STAS domain-containing protein [Micromonospora inositola]SCG55353.1 anti-anti-sigma factor [Micromonospora inositola]
MQGPAWQHTINHLGTASVITLAGELDFAADGDVRQLLDAELQQPSLTDLRIDMTRVTFIDSTMLGTLVHAYNAIDDTDRQLTISPSPVVRRILEITGLSHLFNVADVDPPDAPGRAS